MRTRKWPGSAAAAVSVLAVLVAAGCGGEEAPVVREHDGEELTALLVAARDAIVQDDATSFRALYAADASVRGRNNWNEIKTNRWNWGDYLVSRLMETPRIERKETNLHVERLDLHVWFDFSRDTNDASDVYCTRWSLVREDSLWRLNYVKVEKTDFEYGQSTYDLHHLGYQEYLTLDMDWQEGHDQTPLLARALEAVATGDAERLKPYYVDGALFYARKANVELPKTANDESGEGEKNRSNSLQRLAEEINRMKDSTRRLEADPEALTPFFCAYRMASMPVDCTKLSLITEFDGSYAPSKQVTRFSLMWTGVYLKTRWLVETMNVKSIHFE